MALDEAEFDSLAQAVFRKLLAALDALDPDVAEADSTGEMLTISTASGQKIVVNTQRAARQIWVAGRGEGVHFGYDASGRWLDDRGRGVELCGFVSGCLREACGSPLAL